MSKHAPAPWTLEKIQTFPFGVKITAADGTVILGESAACWSSRQKTRRENEIGFGMDDREQAAKAIAEQDAIAQLFAAAPDLLEALKFVLEVGLADEAGSGIAEDMIRAAIAKAEGRHG